MKIFGLEIARSAKDPVAVVAKDNTSTQSVGSAVMSALRKWTTVVLEPFTGAWQRNISVDDTENLLAFSAVYACITLIAADVSKMRIKLMQQDTATQIWTETTSPAFSPVLRKPNEFQTRIQFLSSWVVQKLIWGNTYVYKQRDQRGVVTALYVLDSKLVTPLVTPSGLVYYQLNADRMSGITAGIIVPATEIIHDRAECLFHPLVGIPPVWAAALSATQGRRIQGFSGRFWGNMARPSGILTSPDEIDDATAIRLKATFEQNFSGENLGRLLVAGSNLKYEAIAVPADQAQLIEQLKFSGEDVARCFHVPAHKLGLGQPPTFNNIAALNQDYFTQCLHGLIENIELLLDEGLGLVDVQGVTYGTELDTAALLRMDPLTQADVLDKKVRAGIWSPNEARRVEDKPPVEGGDTPFMQQQMFPISTLAKQPLPSSNPPAPPPPAAPEPSKHLLLEFDGIAKSVEARAAQREQEMTRSIEVALSAARKEFSDTLEAAAEGVRAVIARAEAAAARLELQSIDDDDDDVTPDVRDFALDVIARFAAEDAEHGD